MVLGFVNFPDGDGFTPIQCPFCGHVENLDDSILDNWDCEKCGETFWLIDARIVVPDDPQGEKRGFQLDTPYPISIRSSCEHLELLRFPSGVIMCAECRMVFEPNSELVKARGYKNVKRRQPGA